MNKRFQKEVTDRLKAIRDGTLDIPAKEQFQWIIDSLPKDGIAYNMMRCVRDGKEYIAYPLIVPGQTRKYWEKFNSKELEDAAKSVGGFITIGDKDFPIVEFLFPFKSSKKLKNSQDANSVLRTTLSTFPLTKTKSI